MWPKIDEATLRMVHLSSELNTEMRVRNRCRFLILDKPALPAGKGRPGTLYFSIIIQALQKPGNDQRPSVISL